MTSSLRKNRLSIALLCGVALLAACNAEQQDPNADVASAGKSRRALTVGTGEFLIDLDPSSQGLDSVDHENLVELNGVLYFAGYEVSGGVEVWRSDGTEEGTGLLADLAPGVGASWPELLTPYNGRLYFTADTDEFGVELWSSDGTGPGTVLVTDFVAGSGDSNPANLTGFNGKLYFTANHPVHGVELWRTDGTMSGTELVVDLNPFGSSNPNNLVVMGDTLYFAADDGTSGIELWRTDGTADGTRLVKDINPGTKSSSPNLLTVVGSKLFFVADNGVNGKELWVSDGTVGNATLVADIRAGTTGTGPQFLIPYNDLLIFTENLDFWRSDGTAEGTFKLGDLRKSASATTVDHAVFKGKLYFVATTSIYGVEIFRTDGTVEGTELAVEVNPSSQASDPAYLAVMGDYLYFAGGTINTPGRRELYRTDGTSEQAELVADINAGTPASDPTELTVIGDTLYFFATSNSAPFAVGRELFKSDGTAAGTVVVRDIRPHVPAHGLPRNYTAFGNKLLFIGSDGVAANGGNKEPFVSDGTAAGTELLADIYPGTSGSSPSPFVIVDDVAYFAASGSSTSTEPGRELWRTDGTPAGTYQVANIVANGSSLETTPAMAAHNGRLYFAATNGSLNGRELWISDGSEDGTMMLRDINPGGDSAPNQFVSLGQHLYFVANDGEGRELWRTDGTETGTEKVIDLNPSGNANPTNLRRLGGKLIFTATDGVTGVELWASDGTETGTEQLADVNPNSTGTASSSSFSGFTVVENRMFFTAFDGVSAKLWVTDGTHGGTFPLKAPRPDAPVGSISSLVPAGNRLFFVADDGVNGAELWTSDGTDTGTRMVADLRPGPAGAAISQITAIGNRVVFAANDGKHGSEIWTSDGTAAGTILLRDVMPGVRGSTPRALTAIAGVVFFGADDGEVGFEPWVTDGTPEGTRLVTDLNPGRYPSDPEVFVRAGQNIFVGANHYMYGREIAVLPLSDELPTITCPADITRSAPGTGKAVVDFAATATDDGESPPVITYSAEPGSEFSVGLTTVTATATDDAGQTSSCSFDIRVVLGDQIPPTLLCPADVVALVTSDTGGEVTYPAAVADDDSGIAPVVSYSHASGALFPLGATEVTVTARDESNNTSTCKFTVTVSKAPNDAPEVFCPPDVTADSTIAGGVEVAYPPAAAFDEDGSDLQIKYSNDSGALFPVGETVVTASATDRAGNTGSCTFKVTVTPPPPAPESGCGCGAAGGEPATGALALVLVFGLAAFRRRGAHSRG